MTRARKVDAVQAKCVAVFRTLGATVQLLHTVGEGCPDALIGYMGENVLVEFKEPGKDLMPNQKEWSDGWHGGPVIVIHDESEVMALLTRVRQMMTLVNRLIKEYVEKKEKK